MIGLRAKTPTRLSFACGVYDRVVPLMLGEVTIPGVDLRCVAIDSPREIFDRLTAGDEFDVAEMSLSEYIVRFVAGECPFVAIPVFPSRIFRHSMIAVNRRVVQSPADLAGKRIGVPLYTMTAAVFIRGMLQHDYGVDLSGVRWIEGAINAPATHGDPILLPLLQPVRIEKNRTGRSLSDLLDRGELDATLGTSMPQAMRTNDDIVRLFPNFRAVEQDYYQRTGIFPIMHVVVIRKPVYERDPDLATLLFTAFQAAKNLALRRLHSVGTLSSMLPWTIDDVDEIERVFGGDPWPYGVESNILTLEALITYLHEQYMIGRKVPAETLFASLC